MLFVVRVITVRWNWIG